MHDAVVPTLRELERRGIAYRGVLYAGLMLTPAGPKMLEYNVRFGDPECEVVVPRLVTDLGELCRAAAAGEPLPEIRFTDDACVTVVLASEGYPVAPRVGDVIEGLADAAAVDGAMVFHAGTRRDGDDARHRRWPGPRRERPRCDGRRRPDPGLRGRRPDHLAGPSAPIRHRRRCLTGARRRPGGAPPG